MDKIKSEGVVGIDGDNTMFSCNSFLYNITAKLKFSSSKNKLKFTEVPYNASPKVNPFLKKIFSFFDSKKYIEFPNAIETINRLHDEGKKIYIITSRPNIRIFIDSFQVWLNDNNVKYDKLIVGCNNKSAYVCENNVDVLIDDHAKICKEVENVGAKSINFKGSLKQKSRWWESSAMQKLSNVAISWNVVFEKVKSILEEENIQHLPLDIEPEGV